MPSRCVAMFCGQEHGLHKWPNDAQLARKWTLFVRQKRDKFTWTKYSPLCNSHFTNDSFENKMQVDMGKASRLFLKVGSVPTIQKLPPVEECSKPTSSNQPKITKKRRVRSEEQALKKLVKELIELIETEKSEKKQVIEQSDAMSGSNQWEDIDVEKTLNHIIDTSDKEIDVSSLSECSVLHCNKIQQNRPSAVLFHPLPHPSRPERAAWMAFCQQDHSYWTDRPSLPLVCSDHFSANMYTAIGTLHNMESEAVHSCFVLDNDAVPTILPAPIIFNDFDNPANGRSVQSMEHALVPGSRQYITSPIDCLESLADLSSQNTPALSSQNTTLNCLSSVKSTFLERFINPEQLLKPPCNEEPKLKLSCYEPFLEQTIKLEPKLEPLSSDEKEHSEFSFEHEQPIFNVQPKINHWRENLQTELKPTGYVEAFPFENLEQKPKLERPPFYRNVEHPLFGKVKPALNYFCGKSTVDGISLKMECTDHDSTDFSDDEEMDCSPELTRIELTERVNFDHTYAFSIRSLYPQYRSTNNYININDSANRNEFENESFIINETEDGNESENETEREDVNECKNEVDEPWTPSENFYSDSSSESDLESDLEFIDDRKDLDYNVEEEYLSSTEVRSKVAATKKKGRKQAETDKVRALKREARLQVVCQICGKKVYNLKSLTHHNLVFHQTNICDVCGKVFYNRRQFYKHITIHDKKDREKIKCEFCNKEFMTKLSYKQHKIRCHSDDYFQCDKCSVKCVSKTRLNHHIRLVHLNVRLHPCLGCNAAFKTSAALVIHMRIHTGEKPHKCNQEGCDYAGKQRHALNWHLKSNHGIHIVRKREGRPRDDLDKMDEPIKRKKLKQRQYNYKLYDENEKSEQKSDIKMEENKLLEKREFGKRNKISKPSENAFLIIKLTKIDEKVNQRTRKCL